jgi:hypothetical protein
MARTRWPPGSVNPGLLHRTGRSDRHRRWVPQRAWVPAGRSIRRTTSRRQPIRRPSRDPGPTLRPHHRKTAEAGPNHHLHPPCPIRGALVLMHLRILQLTTCFTARGTPIGIRDQRDSLGANSAPVSMSAPASSPFDRVDNANPLRASEPWPRFAELSALYDRTAASGCRLYQDEALAASQGGLPVRLRLLPTQARSIPADQVMAAPPKR